MSKKIEVPLVPAVIPFGEGLVLTAAAFAEGKGYLVVRAVADEFVGGDKPAGEAWSANERENGPAWFLSFSTAESARSIAVALESLADQFATPTPDTAA
jgi:hypothetical protein